MYNLFKLSDKMKVIINILFLVCVGNLLAQPNWEFSVTDKSHNILVPSNVDGANFQLGDYIGVFFEENEALICAGYSEYTEGNFVLTAFGESFSFPGFTVGQPFHFMHWSGSTGTQSEFFVVFNSIDFPNEAHFIVDGMSGISTIVYEATIGCTDILAGNYNSAATIDDGSCISIYQAMYLSVIDSIEVLQSNFQNQIDSQSISFLSEMDSLNTILNFANIQIEQQNIELSILFDSLESVSDMPYQINSLEDSIDWIYQQHDVDVQELNELYVDSMSNYLDATQSCLSSLAISSDSIIDLNLHLFDLVDSIGVLSYMLASQLSHTDSILDVLNSQGDSMLLLHSEISTLNNLLIAKDAIIDQLLTENDIQLDSISQLNDIYTIITILENNIFELNQVVMQDENLISQLQSTNSIQQDSIIQMSLLYPLVDDLEDDVLFLENTLSSTISSYQGQLLDMELDYQGQLFDQYSWLTDSLNNIHNQWYVAVDNLVADSLALEIHVYNLQADSTTFEATVAGLLNDVSGLESDVDGLEADVAGLESDLAQTIDDYNNEIDSLLNPTYIDFVDGWNIIAFTLKHEQDVVEAFSPIIDDLQLVKNNAGSVYFVEFGFNGIGNLIPGQGYQVRVYQPIEGFYFE